MVNDGNKCTISDLVLSRYEVGAVREQATRVPIVREVRSGSKFEWTVIAAEGGQLVLDVTSEFQGTDNQLPAEDGSSIRVRCVKIRAIERARLGDRVIIPFDGGRIEATVRDASTSD